MPWPSKAPTNVIPCPAELKIIPGSCWTNTIDTFVAEMLTCNKESQDNLLSTTLGIGLDPKLA